MWRRQDEPKQSPRAPEIVVPPAPEAPPSAAGAVTEPSAAGGYVSQAISVRGEISGREDLFVDGEVQGTIHLTEGRVTIGPNGRVTADIEAGEIIAHGRVQGALRGRERVYIGRTGQVMGDVVTRRIVIEEGAVFRGQVDVVRAEEARVPHTAGRATGAEGLHPQPIHAKDSQS